MFDGARSSATGMLTCCFCQYLLKTLPVPDDLSRKERPGLRERFSKTTDPVDADTDRKDGRYDAINGRRMGQYEKDGARSRRPNEEDDGDVKNKRDGGERTRWGGRVGKDDTEAKEEEDAGKAGARRDREKFQQPWLRGAKIPDSNEDSRRDERKPPDWRRGERGGERGGDRGWDRNDRFEAEPEWMDAGDDDEDPLQSKTMQDFEQWKQRMKTGGASTEVKPLQKIEPPQAVEEKVSKPKLTSRSEHDDAMDKFYASFGAQKLDTVKHEVQAKAPTKSRFANMFGAPVEVPAKLPTPPPTAPPTQAEPAEKMTKAQAMPLGNADQEGFQRILQMLQTRSNNATPQNQRPGSSRASAQRTEEVPKAQELQQRPIMGASRVKSPQEEQPRRANESMLEGLLNIRSPPPLPQPHQRQESTGTDDRQLLLQLLSQADNREQKRTHMRIADPRQMPGLQAAYLNLNQQASAYNQQLASDSNDRRQAQQERPPSFFDEPPLFNTADPNGLRRRLTNEKAMPPFFDDAAYRHNLRQNRQQISEQMQGPPPGLGRPPTYGQMPAFTNQSQDHRQSRQPGPPPGIPNLPMQQRGLPAQFQPPMPVSGQPQPQPRRKYTGEQGPAIPAGMRPPPGFLQNGPPPDFAALAMSQNYGRFQVGGEQQVPPPRDLHDSRYGAAGRTNGMPGAYR